MLKDLLKPEILELIEARRWTELRDTLADWPAPEIADLLLHLRKPDRVLFFRALATGDVRMGDWLRLLGRELGVALLLGLTMAVGVSAISYFRAPEVIAVVALTMTIIVVWGSLIGMLLPFLLTRLGRDPATASAPLITSLADISGVLIYVSIATWYLGL
jgi:magnesium transporter